MFNNIYRLMEFEISRKWGENVKNVKVASHFPFSYGNDTLIELYSHRCTQFFRNRGENKYNSDSIGRKRMIKKKEKCQGILLDLSPIFIWYGI